MYKIVLGELYHNDNKWFGYKESLVAKRISLLELLILKENHCREGFDPWDPYLNKGKQWFIKNINAEDILEFNPRATPDKHTTFVKTLLRGWPEYWDGILSNNYLYYE